MLINIIVGAVLTAGMVGWTLLMWWDYSDALEELRWK